MENLTTNQAQKAVTMKTPISEELLGNAWHFLTKSDLDNSSKIKAVVTGMPELSKFVKEGRLNGQRGELYECSYMINVNIIDANRTEEIYDLLDEHNDAIPLNKFRKEMVFELAVYSDSPELNLPKKGEEVTCHLRISMDSKTGKPYMYAKPDGTKSIGFEISSVDVPKAVTSTKSKFGRKAKQEAPATPEAKKKSVTALAEGAF